MNLDLLRSFFAVAELGSLGKAAERLRVSQSTLTRQMQALEHDVGGRLLERSHSGVALTSAGHALFAGMTPVLSKFDAVFDETRRRARGQSGSLRVGYLMSAAPDYLNPALARLRKAHPEVKVKLLDLSPGEQIAALRQGELDCALVGNADASLAREFFVKRLASLAVVVALAESHELAPRETLRLADLRRENFVGAHESDIPGHNRWIIQLCRRAGFRPRFIGDSDSLTHGLSTLVSENAVMLLPELATKLNAPGVVFRPLQDATAKWELLVAWQRGKASAPVKALLEALAETPGAIASKRAAAARPASRLR